MVVFLLCVIIGLLLFGEDIITVGLLAFGGFVVLIILAAAFAPKQQPLPAYTTPAINTAWMDSERIRDAKDSIMRKRSSDSSDHALKREMARSERQAQKTIDSIQANIDRFDDSIENAAEIRGDTQLANAYHSLKNHTLR